MQVVLNGEGEEVSPQKLTTEYLESWVNAKQKKWFTAAVGLHFRSPEALAQVNTGDAGYLEAELDNKYDPKAVAIIHDKTGNHIGYIKRELNKEIWENIVNHGDLYVCRITRTGEDEAGSKPNLGFNLKVHHLYNER